MQVKNRGCHYSQSINMGVGHIGEGAVEVLRTAGLKNLKPDLQRPRRNFRFLQPDLLGVLRHGIWLEEKGDQTDLRHSLLDQLQALADEFRGKRRQARDIASRMR